MVHEIITIHPSDDNNRATMTYTMRRNLLNWCNLISISKKLMFYVFGVVRIYLLIFSLFVAKKKLVNQWKISIGLKVLVNLFS